ncbi:MAG: hypothetical protein U0136_16420 [Bdellovibrionota bacterium]
MKNFNERSPLKPIIRHQDGSSVETTVNHTFTEEQIRWSQVGSALNSLG